MNRCLSSELQHIVIKCLLQKPFSYIVILVSLMFSGNVSSLLFLWWEVGTFFFSLWGKVFWLKRQPHNKRCRGDMCAGIFHYMDSELWGLSLCSSAQKAQRYGQHIMPGYFHFSDSIMTFDDLCFFRYKLHWNVLMFLPSHNKGCYFAAFTQNDPHFLLVSVTKFV